MTKRLADRVALVTGASSGIGEATALALGAAGAGVALSARRAERLETLARRIGDAGGRALALPGDVGDEATAKRMVADTVAHFGHLDIVVNSAGVIRPGGVENADTEVWRQVIEVNLLASLYVCSAALPHMRALGRGDIVNISSTAGRRAAGVFGPYSTTKHALNGMTEGMRQEVGGHGIRVCVIEPGATESEVADSIPDPGWQDMMRKHVTREGAMKSEDVADAIVFVVSLPPRANVSQLLIRPTSDVAPF